MGTVRDLCKNVLKMGTIIDANEAGSAEDIDLVLTALKMMLSSWSTDGLTIPRVLREEFALVPAQQQYTFGPTGATFTTARPKTIQYAGLISDATEYPMDIFTPKDWAEISQKDLTSEIPSGIYPEGSFPNETIQVWPIPSAAKTLVLYSKKAIDTDLELSDEFDVADGVEEAMLYNCAKRVLPQFKVPLTAEQSQLAMDSYAAIKRGNIKPSVMKCDIAIRQRSPSYDIYKGE